MRQIRSYLNRADLGLQFDDIALEPTRVSRGRSRAAKWPLAQYAPATKLDKYNEISTSMPIVIKKRAETRFPITTAPRKIMLPKIFETQYVSTTTIKTVGEYEIHSRADKLILVNLQNARYLLKDLDLFLYLCPVELTNFLKNWCLPDNKVAKREVDADRQLYTVLKHQLRLSAKAIVSVVEIPLFSVVYRQKQSNDLVNSSRKLFVDMRIAQPALDLSPGRKNLVKERLQDELTSIQDSIASSVKFDKLAEKLISNLDSALIPSNSDELDSYSVSRDISPLTAQESSILLNALTDRLAEKNLRPNTLIKNGKVRLTFPETVVVAEVVSETVELDKLKSMQGKKTRRLTR